MKTHFHSPPKTYIAEKIQGSADHAFADNHSIDGLAGPDDPDPAVGHKPNC